jgi:Rad3-related DNA helicase
MPKFNWEQFFPYPVIRDGQKEAIDSILDAFESGKKYFVLEAGVGIGKSAIAVTVSKYVREYISRDDGVVGGSNILTTQKLLQEQYSNDYADVNSLKSSSNYQCSFHTEMSHSSKSVHLIVCIKKRKTNSLKSRTASQTFHIF